MSYFKMGPNLLFLAHNSKLNFENSIAYSDGFNAVSFKDFFIKCITIRKLLIHKHGVGRGKKVAIISRNSIETIELIFALSGTGADMYLLNADHSSEQLISVTEFYNFHRVFYDRDILDTKNFTIVQNEKFYLIESVTERINLYSRCSLDSSFINSGSLVVMTGGTTGKPKEAGRKPTIFTFISPLNVLLQTVKINNYQKVLTPLPFYHGFGLASIITSLLLGKNIIVQRKFEVKNCVDLISSQKPELGIFVPVMLQRIHSMNPDSLRNFKSIITGGASVSPLLVKKLLSFENTELFNLYGTSEAGFCILSNRHDLKMRPNTIGKPIDGVEVMIDFLNESNLGEICIKSKWTVHKNTWIKTGDIGYKDENDFLFLSGRIDDMIVSGGENVFPSEVENTIMQNDYVREAAVIGIKDPELGEALQAFVVLKKVDSISKHNLISWMKTRVARFQIPRVIEFINELPYTQVGKLDRNKLREMISKNEKS